MLLCDVAKKEKKGDEKQKTAHVESLQNFLDRLVTERATGAFTARAGAVALVFMGDTRNA